MDYIVASTKNIHILCGLCVVVGRWEGGGCSTLMTEGREPSPYVTLNPASRAACSTPEICEGSARLQKGGPTYCSMFGEVPFHTVVVDPATWSQQGLAQGTGRTLIREGCRSNPMYRTGLLSALMASGDSSILATVCPSSPNPQMTTVCAPSTVSVDSANGASVAAKASDVS